MKLAYGTHYIADDRDLITYALIDPAGGVGPAQATRRSDKWGFAIVSVSTDAHFFVRDMYERFLTEAMFMEELWTLDARWHPYRIGIEKSPHLMAYVRLSMAKKGRSLNLVNLEPKGRKKERRIQALSALLPMMYFSDKIAGSVQQTLRRWYPEQEHGDDAIDALAYIPDVCHPPTAQMLDEQRQVRLYAEEQEALERLPASQRPEWAAWQKYERAARTEPTIASEFQDMYDYDY